MTPAEFRAARERLGLSVSQMAALLGVKPIHVRRMETREELVTHRRVMPQTAALVTAWLTGFRPQDWPASKRTG